MSQEMLKQLTPEKLYASMTTGTMKSTPMLGLSRTTSAWPSRNG